MAYHQGRVWITAGTCVKCVWVEGFFNRLRGLLGTCSGQNGSTVFAFRNAPSLHTFGMHYPLDVAFINREGCVVKEERRVRPGRILFCRKGSIALEREASDSVWLEVGDVPRFVCGLD